MQSRLCTCWSMFLICIYTSVQRWDNGNKWHVLQNIASNELCDVVDHGLMLVFFCSSKPPSKSNLFVFHPSLDQSLTSTLHEKIRVIIKWTESATIAIALSCNDRSEIGFTSHFPSLTSAYRSISDLRNSLPQCARAAMECCLLIADSQRTSVTSRCFNLRPAL